MSRRMCCIYLGLTVALCLFFSVGAFFFGPDAEAEGRELSAFPSLRTDEGRLNLEFTEEFETYFSERFALRTELVTLNSLMKSEFFASGTEQVIVGREGYLFFGETLDDYMGTSPMTDGEIADAAAALKAMSDYAAAHGASFLFAAAPNKNTVCGEYMPARYSAGEGESNLDRLYRALEEKGVPYVDLRPVLDGDGLYHKRDTHWNGEGARVAYTAMMAALDLPCDDFSSAERRVTTDFAGDLDALLTPSLTRYDENIVYTLPEFRYTSNYATPMDLIISTARADAPARSALIFRDSFGSALIPYFAASFSEVRFERANPYRIDQLDRKGADVVIVEIAERNLRDLIGAAERVK